jgi:KTSC domain-containing protein
MKPKHPAEQITWRRVKSKNVSEVGWDRERRFYVKLLNGGSYMYEGVNRQRAVACSKAKSVGSYLAREIYPNHRAVKIG